MQILNYMIASINYIIILFTLANPSPLDKINVNLNIKDVVNANSEVKTSNYEGKQQDSFEYESSDEADKEDTAKGNEGTRLVGAKITHADTVPFIVGLGITDPSIQCTGSLISSKWIITAAHCTDLISEKKPKAKKRCVATGQGQVDDGALTFNCKLLGDGSFEYSNIKPEGFIWLGLTNIWEKDKAETHKVKRIIRHKNTYFGFSNYGRNGGYDISLLEMQETTKQPPACLPSPGFNDNVLSKLAGYGSFLRDNGDTCQTDEQGLMKYHYCEQKSPGEDVCKKEAPPQSPVCNQFFKQNPQAGASRYKDAHSNENITPDINLVKNGKAFQTCYKETETNTKYGWCKTKGNYYNLERPKHNFNGWGFCSKDCFLQDRAQMEGTSEVLRIVEKVDVLDDRLCNIYLEKSLNDGEPKTRPQILCVGYIKNFTTESYSLDGRKANATIRHFGDYFNKGVYVTSAGTCHGDSGGPLYVQQGGKFIVTGGVSGGRGVLAKCGGINNPSHYVRIKKFTRWIVKIIGSFRDICVETGTLRTLN